MDGVLNSNSKSVLSLLSSPLSTILSKNPFKKHIYNLFYLV